eukprot:gene3263-6454_t
MFTVITSIKGCLLITNLNVENKYFIILLINKVYLSCNYCTPTIALVGHKPVLVVPTISLSCMTKIKCISGLLLTLMNFCACSKFLKRVPTRPCLSLRSTTSGLVDTSRINVGFVGLGIMGNGMARRLLQSGLSVNVWNRSIDKSNQLKKDYKNNVSIENSSADVVRKCDITFLMLSTPEACDEVYNGNDGVLAGITEGKCIVDCATLQPNDMISTSKKVHDRKGIFLEAPVSGSKVPAETGQLIFLAAGDKSLFESCQPYFKAMGKSNHYVGEIGEGTKMKLVVNSIMTNMLATLAEGLSLTKGSGLEPNMLLQVLSEGVMNNPLFAMKGPRMISGQHPPNFPLKHAYKDLVFAINLAAELNIEATMSQSAEVLYNKAIKQGLGDEDIAAVGSVTK